MKLKEIITALMLLIFFVSEIMPPALAQEVLPLRGDMVWLSSNYQPPVLKGLTVHQENPLLLDFIIHRGQDKISDGTLKLEGEQLIKYFLTSLTIPDKEAWVNLSPYEKDRIIPPVLGSTEMGQQMLEQDYLLKQLSASLTNPDKDLGKKFWDEVRRRSGQREILTSTFNKVWITSSGATVVEKDGFAYITKSHLKVMLEEDFIAQRQEGSDQQLETFKTSENNKLSSDAFRQIILPQLEKEVNEGKNFAPIRQVYQSVILATWYKKALKESLLGKVYADQAKVEGVNTADKDFKNKIYEQYVQTFRRGVYNMIREEEIAGSDEVIPRKYFSGGVTALGRSDQLIIDSSLVAISNLERDLREQTLIGSAAVLTAQLTETQFKKSDYTVLNSDKSSSAIKAGYTPEGTEVNVQIQLAGRQQERKVLVSGGITRFYRTKERLRQLEKDAAALISYIEKNNPGIKVLKIQYAGPKSYERVFQIRMASKRPNTLMVPHGELAEVLYILESNLDTNPQWVLGGGLKKPEFVQNQKSIADQQGWQDIAKVFELIDPQLGSFPSTGLLGLDVVGIADTLKIQDLNRIILALNYLGFTKNDNPKDLLYVYRGNYENWLRTLESQGRISFQKQLLIVSPPALKMAHNIIKELNSIPNSKDILVYRESDVRFSWMKENDKLSKVGETIIEYEDLKTALGYLGLFFTARDSQNDELTHLQIKAELRDGIYSFYGTAEQFQKSLVNRETLPLVGSSSLTQNELLDALSAPSGMDSGTWLEILYKFSVQLGLNDRTPLLDIENFLKSTISRSQYEEISLLYGVKLKPDPNLSRGARRQNRKVTRVNPQQAMEELVSEYISGFRLLPKAQEFFEPKRSSSVVVDGIVKVLRSVQKGQEELLAMAEQQFKDYSTQEQDLTWPQEQIQTRIKLENAVSQQIGNFNVLALYVIQQNPDLEQGYFRDAVDQLTTKVGQVLQFDSSPSSGYVDRIHEFGDAINNLLEIIEDQREVLELREDLFLQTIADQLFANLDKQPERVAAFQQFVVEYTQGTYGYAYENVLGNLSRVKSIQKILGESLRSLYSGATSTNFTHQRFLILLRKVQDQLGKNINLPLTDASVKGSVSSSSINGNTNVGGIDFNPSKLDLQIKRDGQGVPLPLAQQDLEHINIQGLFPVITNIQPMTTIPLGLTHNK